MNYENGIWILKDNKHIHRWYKSGRNNITTKKPDINSGIKNEVWNHRMTEYAELEATHQDHHIQLLQQNHPQESCCAPDSIVQILLELSGLVL